MNAVFFHRVLESDAKSDYSDYHDPTHKELDAFLVRCKKSKHFVSSREMAEMIRAGEKPDPRVLHVSMDDGFASSLQAAEICHRRKVPLTVFVTSDVLDGYVPWFVRRVSAIARHGGAVEYNGRTYDTGDLNEATALHEDIKAEVHAHGPGEQPEALERILRDCRMPADPIPDKLRFLTPGELADLAGSGVEIGCHGASHVHLSGLSGRELTREVRDSRRKLESVAGRTVRYFSYPDGVYDDFLVERLEEEGYEAAFSVATVEQSSLVHAIPRMVFGRYIRLG